jgi:ElaB/YqjD/DUF883 family membrane-anchored ribosome-binding protein
MAASANKSTGNDNAKGVVSDADLEELQKQIAALKTDIAALTTTVRDIGKNRAEALRGAANEQVEALREQGEAALRDARTRGQDALSQAEESIRENPATAVGIAAGLGFLFGLIFGRK